MKMILLFVTLAFVLIISVWFAWSGVATLSKVYSQSFFTPGELKVFIAIFSIIAVAALIGLIILARKLF